VQFHGCGGVFENQREWASAFRDAGWVAVVVDSNTPRGLDAHEVCGGRALLGAERAGDVWVSLADVKRLPFVDPERVILAGWSHGAWSIMDLLAMTAGDELPHNLVGPPVGGMAGVAGLIFIYPYCGAPARAAPWSLDAPSLFVIAGADSVAPPEDCLDLADELTDVGHDVSVRTLAGVDHAFDEDHGPDDYLPFDPEATAQAHAYALEFAARIDSGASRAQEN
jgi:dienelactone hydrolase